MPATPTKEADAKGAQAANRIRLDLSASTAQIVADGRVVIANVELELDRIEREIAATRSTIAEARHAFKELGNYGAKVGAQGHD